MIQYKLNNIKSQVNYGSCFNKLVPLWISLQTAITTIIIVFFLGTLTAWWVLQQKNEVVKIIADGIFTLPLQSK